MGTDDWTAFAAHSLTVYNFIMHTLYFVSGPVSQTVFNLNIVI